MCISHLSEMCNYNNGYNKNIKNVCFQNSPNYACHSTYGRMKWKTDIENSEITKSNRFVALVRASIRERSLSTYRCATDIWYLRGYKN